MRYRHSTVRKIITPGGTTSHQARTKYEAPFVSMLPQLGVGGTMPRPRKLRADSSRMIAPISIAARMKMRGRTFGRMCRNMIRRSRAPIVRADVTNSRSRRLSVWPRTNRQMPVQLSKPMIRMSVSGPGCHSAAMIRSRNSWGIPFSVVMSHVMKSSNGPRK